MEGYANKLYKKRRQINKIQYMNVVESISVTGYCEFK